METYKINMIEEGVEKDLSREDIIKLLKEDVATVTFTKVNGNERVMQCTLLEKVLNDRSPTPEDEKEENLSPSNPVDPPELPLPANGKNALPVFDIEEDDWRSFRFDSIKSIGFPNSIHTDSGTVYPEFIGQNAIQKSYENMISEQDLEPPSLPELDILK